MTKLVEITQKDFDVILDLRYATKNNVCNIPLYSKPLCFLHEKAAEGLKKAVIEAKNLGLKIKVFDGFRPLEVQQFMYDKFPSDDPDGGFISNPKTGSTPHCRGVAIDLTLCDANENELDMGTDFDEFCENAFHRCNKVSIEAQRNRLLLLGIMTLAGFDFYSFEWWHYQLFNPRDFEIQKTPEGFSAV